MTEADQLTIANLVIAITTYRQLQEPRNVKLANLEEDRARYAEAVIKASDRLDIALTRAMVLTGKAAADSFELSIAYQVDDHLKMTMDSDHPEPWKTHRDRAPYVSAWLHDLAFAVQRRATPEAIEAFDKKADAAMTWEETEQRRIEGNKRFDAHYEKHEAERARRKLQPLAPASPDTTGYGW